MLFVGPPTIPRVCQPWIRLLTSTKALASKDEGDLYIISASFALAEVDFQERMDSSSSCESLEAKDENFDADANRIRVLNLEAE